MTLTFGLLDEVKSNRQKPERDGKWYHNCKHPRSSVEEYAQCRAHQNISLVECHAVLLPGAALVHPARVSVRAVIWHWHPGEATNVRRHQGDISTASDLNMRNQLDWSIWVGGSHESPILSELAEWAWDLVGLREFTVNLEVFLNVCKAGEHLWPSRGVPKPGVKIQKARF